MSATPIERQWGIARTLQAVVDGTAAPAEALRTLLAMTSPDPQGVTVEGIAREVLAVLGAALVDLGRLDEAWTPAEITDATLERGDLGGYLADVAIGRLLEVSVLAAAGNVTALDELFDPLEGLSDEDRGARTVGLLAAAMALAATALGRGARSLHSLPGWSLEYLPRQGWRTFFTVAGLADPDGSIRDDLREQHWRFHHHGRTFMLTAYSEQEGGITETWYELHRRHPDIDDWAIEWTIPAEGVYDPPAGDSP